MLILYRTALDNLRDPDNIEKSIIYFEDKKTKERFSALCLSLEIGEPINETTPKGNTLFGSYSEWLIETDKGEQYTRKVEHRTDTHIFYPDGWDSDETESAPISLYAISCTKEGSVKVGVIADDWVKIERGDIGE